MRSTRALIRSLTTEKSISLGKVCERLNVSRTALRRWMLSPQMLKMANIIAISSALGLNADEERELIETAMNESRRNLQINK